jgi:hypothetical protein
VNAHADVLSSSAIPVLTTKAAHATKLLANLQNDKNGQKEQVHARHKPSHQNSLPQPIKKNMSSGHASTRLLYGCLAKSAAASVALIEFANLYSLRVIGQHIQDGKKKMLMSFFFCPIKFDVFLQAHWCQPYSHSDVRFVSTHPQLRSTKKLTTNKNA